jgi:hypothetical protein
MSAHYYGDPIEPKTARRSALRLAEDVLRRSVPLPGQLRLKETYTRA